MSIIGTLPNATGAPGITNIKNQFFLITDKIAQGDLEVKYAPTKEMWADVNTKPHPGTIVP